MRYSRILLAFALAVASPFAARALFAGDVVRYLAPNDEGQFEERAYDGTLTGMTRESLSFKVDEDAKNAPEGGVVASDAVVWLTLEDAPAELSTAQVEIELGNYEEALEKLASIAADDLDEEKFPWVKREVEWNAAVARLQLALADGGSLSDGGKAIVEFVQSSKEHYRFYDALRLTGEAFLSRATASEKDRDAAIKRAKSAFTQMTKSSLASYRASGNLGLGRAALLEGASEEALGLFEGVVSDAELSSSPQGAALKADGRLWTGRAQSASGRYEDALRTLNEALASTPNTETRRQAEIYNAIGEVDELSELNEDAIIAYLHVDLLYPTARAERIKALKALARLWRKVGRDDRADETIARLKERFNVEID